MSEIKKIMEYRTFSFKFDNVDSVKNEGKVEGYASVFGNIDLGLDIVVKGAFKKTLKENKGVVPILADHSPYDQIGWNESASEDSYGLKVQGSIMLDVQKGQERYTLAKKAQEIGAPAGLSIGYMTIKSQPYKDNPNIRELVELKLYEYSFVTFPMNTLAMVTAAKNMGMIDKARFLIKQCEAQGVSIKDLESALRLEAANVDYDPTKISQSYDRLIDMFRQG